MRPEDECMRLTPTDAAPSPGVVHYAFEDHAINFSPADKAERGRVYSSIALGTVQIHTDEGGQCLWAWGYCPVTSWRRCAISVRPAKQGGLQVSHPEAMYLGVSVSLGPKHWGKCFDLTTGWLRLTPDGEAPEVAQAVEFATDIVALLSAKHRLLALLIRPVNWQMIAAHIRQSGGLVGG
jgi:hypothetical protein